jgi:hypothetical protein
MTRARYVPLLVAGLLVAGVAACTNAPGSSPTPTASPTSPPPPPCPQGSWQSTGVSASPSVFGVTITLQGASGVKMTVGAGGKVTADFSGMTPVTFSTQVGTAAVKGEITYQGTTGGTLDLSTSSPVTASPGTASSSPVPSPTPAAAPSSPSGSASPSASGSISPSPTGASGAWNPTGPVDMSNLRVTVKLLQPLATTLVDNKKVTDVTGNQTTQAGGAVDLQPLLRAGTFQCDGQKGLTITTSGGGLILVWTMTRM